MNSSVRGCTVAALTLVAAGGIADAVSPPIAPACVVDAAPPGPSATRRGGFSRLAADLAWIKLQGAWEAGDYDATLALVTVAPSLDPTVEFFWVNGARMLAYDLPAWRIGAMGGAQRVPRAVRDRVRHEQAVVGWRHLNRGLAANPASSALYIERANLEANALNDFNAAAESYRRAAAIPGAPYYAARLQAEMLRRAGRNREALRVLVRLHPTLPPALAAAAADTVLARIRALERQVGIPPALAYRPPNAVAPPAKL